MRLRGIYLRETVYKFQKTKKNKSKYRVYQPSEVPKLHWCGHYLDPDTRDIIPDGAECCFWHWIGLPTRFGVRHPAYPFQEEIFDEYFNQHKRLFYFGKPPKVGATQTWLEIALDESLNNPDWKNGQVAIVVGTGGNEAEKMIDRCKELLAYKDDNGISIRDPNNGELITKVDINYDYNTKKEFSINSVEFRAHPANNVDSIRSQPNMRMILIDEIAFFKMVEQQKVRDAFEHYIGGSDVIIVLITTAGFQAAGVAYEIETEHPTMYTRHLYDYNIGLVVHPESMTSLYRKADIDMLRDSSSFDRNFRRIWGHGSGNIYTSKIIDYISKEWYELRDISHFDNVLAIDPAYGKVRTDVSSRFGGVGGYIENGKINTRSVFELENPSDEEALQRIRKEIKDYGYKNLIIDGHWTGIIKTFQNEINSYGVNYNEYGLNMTDEAEKATTNLQVRIHPTHEIISSQLKAITRGDNGMPDKKKIRFDVGDCFQQMVWHFNHGTVAIVKG